ncbi:MAG: putative long-chain-fatty-acid--CoA ligase [Magnetococcales bacterium]|nr:putative long-chain-fatty-acid--CoA ligase [Magnetococcales bacterium]
MSAWIESLNEKLSSSSSQVTEVESGRILRYQDLVKEARRYYPLLQNVEQHVVTVILPNSIEYLACYIGVVKCRNIFNPVPYFVEAGELARILEYVQPTLVVTDRQDLQQRFANQYRVITPSQLTEMGQEPKLRTTDDDIAALYYSSGTTGNPKGVLYSHDNNLHLISSINRGFGFTGETRQFAFLPFGHTASINYNILPALFSGGPLIISRGFDQLRNNFFNVLERYAINYTELVPSVLRMLIRLQHNVKNLDLASMEFIGCGSSTLDLDSQVRFIQQYGIKTANLYGLSETGPSHIDDPRESNWEPGSIGKPLDVNQCRIAEDGEILLKGRNVFVGYYKNQALYNEVVQNGWFQTGDLGEVRAGRFYFTDRKKDLIIKSGINIVPAEIEEIIYRCTDVLECAVVGRPDPIHGEVVVAALVAKSPELVHGLEQRVHRVCTENLSSYKIPSQFQVVDEIPKTHSGKLLRKVIRAKMAK